MKTRRQRTRPEAAEQESSAWPGVVVLLVMVALAAGIIAWGHHRHRLDWKNVLAAVSCFLTAIAFVAIGLFELEWLERIVGFIDGIASGLSQWVWTSWFGTLSESDFVGRRRARVIWVVFGIIAFLFGCVLALGVV